MLYILEIYALVAAFVFGSAGMVILAFAVWMQAKDYARARHAMRRIASPEFREHIANSRSNPRTHDPDFYRAA